VGWPIIKAAAATLAAIAPPVDQRSQWLRLDLAAAGTDACSIACITRAANPADASGGNCWRRLSRAMW
jgi:hypothetical protein